MKIRATSRDGIEVVLCVHTSQGVEFDWLGVLIGGDLTFKDGKIVGDPAKRAKNDKSLNGWKKELKEAGNDQEKTASVLEKVQSIIKNTYKVLLSRGRMGCYVWCADAGLREYLKKRLSLATSDSLQKIESLLTPIRETVLYWEFYPFVPEVFSEPEWVNLIRLSLFIRSRQQQDHLVSRMPRIVSVGSRRHPVSKSINGISSPRLSENPWNQEFKTGRIVFFHLE